jgi:hypothetical protein
MDLGPGTLGAALRRCTIGVLDLVVGVIDCITYAVRVLRATAFWGSIFLPFVVIGGLLTDAATAAPVRLALLVGLNGLCILLGRRHRPGD